MKSRSCCFKSWSVQDGTWKWNRFARDADSAAAGGTQAEVEMTVAGTDGGAFDYVLQFARTLPGNARIDSFTCTG
jgi:hypothetical protein